MRAVGVSKSLTTSAGLVVFQTVTFNLPTSVVEALLPRF